MSRFLAQILRAFASVMLLAACHYSPPVPVPPDADASPFPPPAPSVDASPSSDGGACSLACAALLAAQCPEGKAANCVATFSKIDTERLDRVPCGASVCPSLTCAMIARARGVNEVRTLGIGCDGGQ